MRQCTKLYGNSMSGKPSQKPFYEKSVLYDRNNTEDFRKAHKRGVDMGKIFEVEGITQNIVIQKEYSEKANHMPVQLSSQIYALARNYMFDNIFSKAKVHGKSAYGDTDSGIVGESLYNTLSDKMGKNLGDFDLEWKVDRVTVVGAKAYNLEGINDKNKFDTKTRYKGVQLGRDRFDNHGKEEVISKVNGYDFVKTVLDAHERGEKVAVKSSTMKRKDCKITYQKEVIKFI